MNRITGSNRPTPLAKTRMPAPALPHSTHRGSDVLADMALYNEAAT